VSSHIGERAAATEAPASATEAATRRHCGGVPIQRLAVTGSSSTGCVLYFPGATSSSGSGIQVAGLGDGVSVEAVLTRNRVDSLGGTSTAAIIVNNYPMTAPRGLINNGDEMQLLLCSSTPVSTGITGRHSCICARNLEVLTPEPNHKKYVQFVPF